MSRHQNIIQYRIQEGYQGMGLAETVCIYSTLHPVYYITMVRQVLDFINFISILEVPRIRKEHFLSDG